MSLILSKIFKLALSDEEKVSSEAILSLACILEMHSWNLSLEDRKSKYLMILRKDFFGISNQEITELFLDEEELLKIVYFLTDEIEHKNKLTSSFFAALGQSPSTVGLIPCLSAFKKVISSLNEDEMHEAINALDKMFFFDERLSEEQEKRILQEYNILVDLSAKILELQPIEHIGLEEMALRFMSRLILILNYKE